MTNAIATIEIAAPPQRVWQLIGGFGSLPYWLPYIHSSELSEGGRVRRLVNTDGQTIMERLVKFDDAARSYSYTILQAPFPVTDYLSTLCVHDVEDGTASRVDWSGEFTPNGIDDHAASQLFIGIFDTGLKALAPHFDSK